MRRCIVPDTAVLAAAFFKETHSARAVPILEAIRNFDVDTVAPLVFLTEFANVCRKKIKEGVDKADVDEVMRDLLGLPILWWDSIELGMRRAWDLHRSFGMGTNDAHFFILAQEWNAEVWTLDGGFVTAGNKAKAGVVQNLATTAFRL